MEDTPLKCLRCKKAWNAINGRYCPDEKVQRYVTHDGKGMRAACLK